jgi:hypothetical protein
MNTQILKQAIQEALKGSRKVEITFRRDALSEVPFLLGMKNSGIISLNMGDEHVLANALRTLDWGVDSNRTLTVTLTGKFDEDWFVGRMRRALEKIEAVK